MANNALGFSCILSKFYIKPQLFIVLFVLRFCCILSKFYIKPQLRLAFFFQFVVVSYRNSTSNHNVFAASANFTLVVSYRNSTSNHNLATVNAYFNYVVSYRNSTSNHNSSRRIDNPAKLYLIEILHQTTTVRFDGSTKNGCILSKFYIKPQPLLSTSKRSLSCILSKFYIKPQQLTPYRQPGEVVSYRNSTSNHNLFGGMNARRQVVSYRNSTSNHNLDLDAGREARLYLIEILHQTTT